MSPAWSAEWAVALRRRRLLLLNLLVPLLLVAPVALAAPPPAHAAGVYTVLFVFFGVFGSAIPLVRDGAYGTLARWRLAGLADRAFLLGRLSAQTSIDCLELLPAAALVAWSAPDPSPATAWPLLVALVFTLSVGNALGAWAAAFARSLAESALFAAVGSLLLLHGAGVFRTPAPGSPASLMEAVSPFRVLHELLLEEAGGPAAEPALWMPALVVGALLLSGTWALASTLVGRLMESPEA